MGVETRVEWYTMDHWTHIVGLKELTDVVIGLFDKVPPPRACVSPVLARHTVHPAASRHSMLLLSQIVGETRFKELLHSTDTEFDTTYSLKMPPGYGDEMKGIAAATGLEISVTTFYSVFGACTSIVAEDDKGGMYHARTSAYGQPSTLLTEMSGSWPSSPPGRQR